MSLPRHAPPSRAASITHLKDGSVSAGQREVDDTSRKLNHHKWKKKKRCELNHATTNAQELNSHVKNEGFSHIKNEKKAHKKMTTQWTA
jgi:hypothetical protein